MTLNFKIDPYIISETRVNHNGSLKIVKSVILNTKRAGANSIKFKLYNTSKIITKYSKLAPYQKKNSKLNISQYELISNLQIAKKLIEWIKEDNNLKNYKLENYNI
jgi:N,N'-diacetyllegionaminate synthase